MRNWVILLAVASLSFSTVSVAASSGGGARSHDVIQTLPGSDTSNSGLSDYPSEGDNLSEPAPANNAPAKHKKSTKHQNYSKAHHHKLHGKTHLTHKKSHSKTRLTHKKSIGKTHLAHKKSRAKSHVAHHNATTVKKTQTALYLPPVKASPNIEIRSPRTMTGEAHHASMHDGSVILS